MMVVDIWHCIEYGDLKTFSSLIESNGELLNCINNECVLCK